MKETKQNAAMTVTFWGVRGTGAATGREYLEYGGNTSCVSVETPDAFFIFDAGTGLEKLGKYLKNRAFSGELHLFLSHLHLDHIYGLPLFCLVFNPSVRIHLYGERRPEGSLRERLKKVLGPPYWPVSPDHYQAELSWHEIDEKDGGIAVTGNGWQVRALSAVHPNGGLLYRLETEKGAMVYGLDCEMPETFQEQFVRFAEHADLLIFDGTYRDEEYPAVLGYGHGTWQQAVALTRRSSVKKTLVAHHKLERTDAELKELECQASNQEKRLSFAREGMQVIL